MQKIRLFFLLFLFPISLLAQQRTKIILEKSERGSLVKDISYLRNPVFRHENGTLTCDSAVFYENKNTFEAFENVHINQGDTINIYSDHLVYDGNTKIAHLTSNVRMIDKESVLTTNILDYNMATKIGTYVNGGKVVNKDVTLTSKNGYYFSNSRDSYFRYNVLVVTPQSKITSDTLRYNTLTNWTYFYGPTNIKGKDDNLYTENGAYNTKTEYAYFGKKNLYTNGTKSLKGDSLYYDGIAGYGKAVRNIIFKDTADKTVLYGQLGYYYKADQRAVVTKNAYVGMGTSDSLKVKDKLQPDSLWMGADTLVTQMALQKNLKLIESPILKKDNELGEEEEENPEQKVTDSTQITKNVKEPVKKPAKEADKETPKLSKKDRRNKKRSAKNKPAEISLPKDSLIKNSLVKDSLIKDSLVKDSVLKVSKAKDNIVKDSLVKDSIAKIKKPDIPVVKDSVKVLKKDSVPPGPLDTLRTRIIKAYHNVRVYKSNMQALADSLFYTNADSTLRWYGSPILWSQGSQQTGDTLYLRLKNKKLNTLQVIQNGFLVNVNADSAKFNQIKGKLITAFFKDGELSTMFVDGNAESVYYNRDKDSVYTDMNQSVSSRIKIHFKNREITEIFTIKDPEGIRVPITELKEDVLLTGFIWKPELRPLSKKEIITGKPKTKTSAKKGTVNAKSGPVKKADGIKPSGVKKTPLKQPAPKETDSVKTSPVKLNTAKTDSVKTDTAKVLPVPVKLPLAKQDSTLKKSLPDSLKKQ